MVIVKRVRRLNKTHFRPGSRDTHIAANEELFYCKSNLFKELVRVHKSLIV